MKLSRRGSWLVTLSLVAAAVAYLMLGFLPGMRTLADCRRQLTERQEYVTQADRLKAQVDDTERELVQLAAFNARYMPSGSPEAELANLFGQINAQAKAAGVAPKRFEPQKRSVELETLRQTSLAFEATGTFSEVVGMLASLERLPALIWFESVKIKPQREDGQKEACELKMAVFSARGDKND